MLVANNFIPFKAAFASLSAGLATQQLGTFTLERKVGASGKMIKKEKQLDVVGINRPPQQPQARHRKRATKYGDQAARTAMPPAK